MDEEDDIFTRVYVVPESEADHIHNVILDLKSMLEHYVSPSAYNWDGVSEAQALVAELSTRTQALATIKQANKILQTIRRSE